MTSNSSLDVIESKIALLELTVAVVAAYVGRNALPATELPAFIDQIHYAVVRVATGRATTVSGSPKPPAVSIEQSMTKDHITCLEDGKKFKSLRRHLATAHAMSPQEYRRKWGLPADYPMITPVNAAARASLAKDIGLGRKRRASRVSVVDSGPTGKSEATS